MKKNKFVKFISIVCVCLCMGLCFAGCDDNANGKKGNGILDPIDQEKWLLGGCEIATDTMDGGEDGATSEWCAQMAGAFGAKSQRVWMHIPTVIKRAKDSDALSVKRYEADKYHKYFRLLKENGVERIVAMNHRFLYPFDFENPQNKVDIVLHPHKDPELYAKWVQMYYECYRLLASEFTEVTFWEPENEFDNNKFGSDESALTPDDMGFIAADLCYAANKGIKEINPKNVCVYPGLTCNNYSSVVLKASYEYIENKTLPTIEEYYVNDPDAYFDVVAWHPYAFAENAAARVKSVSLEYYDIMKAHGDGEKRVFLTEFGMSEDWRKQSENPQDVIAKEFAEAIEVVKGELPFVETVFLFRYASLYGWTSSDSKENTFGLFYSPSDPVNRGKPKPVALAIYRAVYGENADVSPLYVYCKEFGITE